MYRRLVVTYIVNHHWLLSDTVGIILYFVASDIKAQHTHSTASHILLAHQLQQQQQQQQQQPHSLTQRREAFARRYTAEGWCMHTPILHRPCPMTDSFIAQWFLFSIHVFSVHCCARV